ncbi:MAG: hypothetical protein ACM3IJ_01960 [Candidatus Levyibacteriota bacterium]
MKEQEPRKTQPKRQRARKAIAVAAIITGALMNIEAENIVHFLEKEISPSPCHATTELEKDKCVDINLSLLKR